MRLAVVGASCCGRCVLLWSVCLAVVGATKRTDRFHQLCYHFYKKKFILRHASQSIVIVSKQLHGQEWTQVWTLVLNMLLSLQHSNMINILSPGHAAGIIKYSPSPGQFNGWCWIIADLPCMDGSATYQQCQTDIFPRGPPIVRRDRHADEIWPSYFISGWLSPQNLTASTEEPSFR